MSSTRIAAPRSIGVTTAGLLVIASMVGTGVFTTTGFLIRDLRSAPAVLLVWALGGAAALSGALCFAELGAALPHNGGEYRLLSRIYHPGVGFVAGWISLVVGFSAPTAASAIAFGRYLQHVLPLPPLALGGLEISGPSWAGALLIALTSALHALRLDAGKGFQNGFTVIKAGLIGIFILAGLFAMDGEQALAAERGFWDAVFSSELAIGLVYVSFAYSGWNAAIYVAGEVRSPSHSLPRALVLGTLIVTLLYLGLNLVLLGGAPAAALSGQVEVAQIAAVGLFGQGAATLLSALIALGLISTVGAFVMTGPRVYEAMGEDFPRLALLARRRPGGGPALAIGIQAVLAIVMALSASFDALLEYIGLTLTLITGLTAAGVFVLRVREPGLERSYRTLGYPLTPLIFLGLTLWMAVHTALGGPWIAALSLVTILSGLGLYWILRRPSPPSPAPG